MHDWLNILEDHFNHRKKAFLIFDDKNVLRYISGFAKEILGSDDNHIGYISFNELFPPSNKNQQFLVDNNHSPQALQNIIYTMPSGRSQELRISKESRVHASGDLTGYVVWLEARTRDITGAYRKVSDLDPFMKFDWLFEQNKCGFLLVDNEGIIQKYNEKIKFYLHEPSDWQGRNIFTFSSIHQFGLDRFFSKIMRKKRQPEFLTCDLKFPGDKDSLSTRWSCFPLFNMEESFIGAIITVIEAERSV